MRSLILCSAVVLLAAGRAFAADAAAGNALTVNKPRTSEVTFAASTLERLELGTAGGQRSTLVYDAGTPTSLVVLLHGYGSDAEQMRAATGHGFERLAAQAGWLVAYPEGVGKSWNDCRRTPQYPARRARADDVAFLVQLIEQLRERHGIPAERVLVGGFSNGGHMALRLALERPDAIGGMLLIAAQLPTAAESLCAEGGRGINALLISGTADRIAPYAGGDSRGADGAALGPVDSVMSSARRLAVRGGRAVRSRQVLGNRDGDATTTVELTRWRAAEALVELYSVRGGGHTIPQPIVTFPSMFGATSADIDTASATLTFMKQWAPRRVAGWRAKADALRAEQAAVRRALASSQRPLSVASQLSPGVRIRAATEIPAG
jgi:polyhydroxybutyrate depolymerase